MSFAYRLSSNLNRFVGQTSCSFRSFRGCLKLWEGPNIINDTSRSRLNSLQRCFKLWEGSRLYHAYVTSLPSLNGLSKQNVAPKPLLRRGVSSILGHRKHIVFCYPEKNEYPVSMKCQTDPSKTIYKMLDVSFVLVSVSVDEKLCFCNSEASIQSHRARYYTNYISSIFINNPREPCLYFLGCLNKSGQDKSGRNFSMLAPPDEPCLKDVYCYDIRKEFEDDSIIRCESMKCGISYALSVQINGCIYLLSYPSSVDKVMDYFYKTDTTNGILRPLLQKYDIKKKTWDLVGGRHSDIINLRASDRYVLIIRKAPHVVIGTKLHVSIGNSSFTFDSCTQVWEKSKLFEKFWSEQENNKSGLSPTNFYGYKVGVDDDYAKLENGGPPLGFYGKGIVWEENILLGIHHCADCPLVAFLLDEDENGDKFVVKSQPISLGDVTLQHLSYSKLVNLGNGYFCLMYIVREIIYDEDSEDEHPYELDFIKRYMELVTFKVSRLENVADNFLECKLVSTKRVEHKLPSSIDQDFEAFSV